jgi:hypothetical protein
MVLIVVTEILNTVMLEEQRFGSFIYIHLQVERGKEENLLW